VLRKSEIPITECIKKLICLKAIELECITRPSQEEFCGPMRLVSIQRGKGIVSRGEMVQMIEVGSHHKAIGRYVVTLISGW
jgi:hypothetical protein